MALYISERKGIFYVEGKIETETLRSFSTYFIYINNNKVIVNIDKVRAIYVDGLKALQTLHRNAAVNNKVFSLIGYCSKDIYNHFQSNQLSVA